MNTEKHEKTNISLKPDSLAGIDDASLTARGRAAIALRVPDSGLPWLDSMIIKANCADMVRAMVGNSAWITHIQHPARDGGYDSVMRCVQGIVEAINRREWSDNGPVKQLNDGHVDASPAEHCQPDKTPTAKSEEPSKAPSVRVGSSASSVAP
jgi:hypothetical protein